MAQRRELQRLLVGYVIFCALSLLLLTRAVLGAQASGNDVAHSTNAGVVFRMPKAFEPGLPRRLP